MSEDRPEPLVGGGPPLHVGVEVLAGLHADALDPGTARTVAAQVEQDLATRSVLRALDATVADLAVLGASPVDVPVPPDVAARLDAALAGLSPPGGQQRSAPGPAAHGSGLAPVLDLATARTRRRRLLGAGGLAVAAAAVAVVVLGGLLGGAASSTDGTAVAQPLDLGSGQLGTTVLASLGRTDLGPLRDPATLAGCLAANGITEGTPVLGSAQVLLRGEPGTLLLLTTGTAGSFTALVVGPACSATDPAQLAQQRIGAR